MSQHKKKQIKISFCVPQKKKKTYRSEPSLFCSNIPITLWVSSQKKINYSIFSVSGYLSPSHILQKRKTGENFESVATKVALPAIHSCIQTSPRTPFRSLHSTVGKKHWAKKKRGHSRARRSCVCVCVY